jgi:glycosyltransferase involved in cell wall biosynthesis
LAHPRKRLTLVGPPTSDTVHFAQLLQHDDIRVMGAVAHQDLKHLMSASDVMVMPSIEEGLALVQAEALACGCPVIGTDHSGAVDLFDHDREGFIVPIRSDAAIREKLEYLADNPDRRQQMSEAARARVADLGGWSRYGEHYFELLQRLVGKT